MKRPKGFNTEGDVMNQDRIIMWLLGVTLFFLFLLTFKVNSSVMGAQKAPDPVTLELTTRPDLLHISGKYRVLVYNGDEYIGYMHLTHTELSRGLKWEYHIQLDLTNYAPD